MKTKLKLMKLEEISHPELKNLINLIYMQSENNNQEKIDELKIKINNYLSENEFIISTEDNHLVKIPYGNDGEYVSPIFTDKREYDLGMEYFRLNAMDENKSYEISKLKKEENPNFLGYLINIASASYIIRL